MSQSHGLKAVTLFTSADHPVRRWRRFRENLVAAGLFLAATTSVIITLGILFVVLKDALPFFAMVPVWDFLTGTEWTPLFDGAKFGILPLVTGTFLSTFVALLVALPLGTVISTYLAEYANPREREILKPILELLAAVPTVVYGYFALLFVSPMLQKIVPELGGFSILSAGLVMGVMIIPYVASLTEDALRAVPDALREGSYALGATKLQTAWQVVFPAASSGIVSSYILAISRAVGETMIVAIAAGLQPNFTLDPRQPAATITAFIVQVSMGDLPHGSTGYKSIYVAGLTLLVFTFALNVLGYWIKHRYKRFSS